MWDLGLCEPFIADDDPTLEPWMPDVSHVLAKLREQEFHNPFGHEEVMDFLAAKEKANLEASLPPKTDIIQSGDIAEANQMTFAPYKGATVDVQDAGVAAEEAKMRVARLNDEIQKGLTFLEQALGADQKLTDHLYELSGLRPGLQIFVLKLWWPLQCGTTQTEYQRVLVISNMILCLIKDARAVDFNLLEDDWRMELEHDFTIIAHAVQIARIT